MKINRSSRQSPQYTHLGALSSALAPLQKLRRSVMACMLWEDSFYENGESVIDRIEKLCEKVDGQKIVDLAVEAHEKGFLRHVPLKLIVQSLHKQAKCADAIAQICSRPDQMTELLALYWQKGRCPIAKQLKKGLAKAFTQFDEYQLAKWNKDSKIKLRDVLFLCHAKPKDEAQSDLWKRLINDQLKIPDTWETKLSSGKGKKESFVELLEKGKMSKQAVLMNLKNMYEAEVPKKLVEKALMQKSRPLLPFQFISAATACPQWEDLVDQAMIQAIEGKTPLLGFTVVFVDHSGSMNSPLAARSTMTRRDAAAALAILLREICEKFEFFSFSSALAQIPPRRGLALRDAIQCSQPPSGTFLGGALELWKKNRNSTAVDRVIVITDEQIADTIPVLDIPKCYILNIASYQNGIKDNGKWHTISGFSPAVIDYIQEAEKIYETEKSSAEEKKEVNCPGFLGTV